MHKSWQYLQWIELGISKLDRRLNVDRCCLWLPQRLPVTRRSILEPVLYVSLSLYTIPCREHASARRCDGTLLPHTSAACLHMHKWWLPPNTCSCRAPTFSSLQIALPQTTHPATNIYRVTEWITNSQHRSRGQAQETSSHVSNGHSCIL